MMAMRVHNASHSSMLLKEREETREVAKTNNCKKMPLSMSLTSETQVKITSNVKIDENFRLATIF